jgi:hypothetical protein
VERGSTAACGAAGGCQQPAAGGCLSWLGRQPQCQPQYAAVGAGAAAAAAPGARKQGLAAAGALLATAAQAAAQTTAGAVQQCSSRQQQQADPAARRPPSSAQKLQQPMWQAFLAPTSPTPAAASAGSSCRAAGTEPQSSLDRSAAWGLFRQPGWPRGNQWQATPGGSLGSPHPVAAPN